MEVVQITLQERISKLIIDRIVDVPVLMQRQVSTTQTVQKAAEVHNRSLIEWWTFLL